MPQQSVLADVIDGAVAGAIATWVMGQVTTALYEREDRTARDLRPRIDIASVGGGLLFGTAFWLLMDETVTPATGLTKGPTAFPWQTHARGLAGHLVFGAVADRTLAGVQQQAS